MALSFHACRGTDNAGSEGRQNEQNTQTQGTPSSSAALNSDSSLAGSDISSQAGEALSSTMNMDVSAGLGLMLTASLDGVREQNRDCTAGDEHTEVSISRDFSKSFDKSHGEFNLTGGFSDLSSTELYRQLHIPV